MKSDKKMPSPWRDPSSGIYYLNTRVPTDLVPVLHKRHVQKSLKTKDRREAERLCCEEWLILQREFDRQRRKHTSHTELSEELIPHVLDEWLHTAIREDEEARLTGFKERTDEGRAQALSDLIEDLAQGQHDGKHPEWLMRRAGDLLREKSILFDSRSLPFLKLVEALSERYVRLFEVQYGRDIGKRVASPEAPREVLTVSQLYQKFKATSIAEKRWKNPLASDSRDYGPIVREFITVVGDKAAHSLAITDAQKYYDHTIERQDISLGTKKRNLTRIKTVLLFGRKSHQVPDITAPLQISTSYRRTHQSYERFSADDLGALFHSDAYRNNTFRKASQYWLPMFGLYTGARLDEPASLLVTDVEKREGVWSVYLSNPEANGGGKNEQAPRWLPLHQELIKAGFLGYWETVKAEGMRRVFPELGEAARDGCSKRATVDFTEYRRSVGVGEKEARSNKAFHSFRSTLVSELTEKGADAEIKRRIVGHSGAGDVHDVIYNQAKFSLPRLLEALSLADFGLAHPVFVENEAMKKARGKHRK